MITIQIMSKLFLECVFYNDDADGSLYLSDPYGKLIAQWVKENVGRTIKVSEFEQELRNLTKMLDWDSHDREVVFVRNYEQFSRNFDINIPINLIG